MISFKKQYKVGVVCNENNRFNWWHELGINF